MLFSGRDGLGAYIADPASFPSSRVIYHDASFVAIHDLYPKSSVHTLLLPRSAAHTNLHPFDALADEAFLAAVRGQVESLRRLVAAELRRRYGHRSAQDCAREAAMQAEDPPAELPPGRDWGAAVLAGVHAHPSMSQLHVHVLSADRANPSMRKKKHYNSFATPFFVPLDAFPLARDDVRRHPGRQGYLDRALACWRCGKNFGNRFAQLKTHLEEEFEAWKAE